MQHLWTWRGRYFGYRDGNDLWTYRGKHVGHFHGNEVYGPDGAYLGEIRGDRLISFRNKRMRRAGRFMPYGRRMRLIKLVDYVGYAMLARAEDFPRPEEL